MMRVSVTVITLIHLTLKCVRVHHHHARLLRLRLNRYPEECIRQTHFLQPRQNSCCMTGEFYPKLWEVHTYIVIISCN